MARVNAPLVVFNRGRISRLGLARTDLDRTRLSAEIQTNWIPRTLGSMTFRPGLGHLGTVNNSSTAAFIPFVFNNRDTALIELTSTSMRVWIDDAVVTRSGVSSVVANSSFTTDLTDWADNDDSGSTSEWITGAYMGLAGTRYAFAKRRQTVSVASTDIDVEHGLAVKIDRGRVRLRVGSSAGGDDYIREATLRPGDYSFAVTPSTDIYLELAANTEYLSRVASVSIESSGPMVVPTPWASTDLDFVRFDPSADVTFVACRDVKQRRIERHAARSWAVAHYEPEDGPFRAPNVTNARLTPSALTGNITLAADPGVFRSSHEDATFQITSIGQEVEGTFTGADQWTDSIRVSGVQDTRKFQYLVTAYTGSTVGDVVIQRSDGETGNWANVSGLSFSATIDSTHDDGLDNNISFYRIGMPSGSSFAATDSVTASLVYASGGLTGVVRVVSVVAATESSAVVLTPMGSTSAVETWREGDWSDRRGYPTSVRLHEGRLWWAGKGKVWGSVSDAYESFDPDTEGDSGPINRSFGSGAVDDIPWMASLGRLIIGAESREVQVKTDSLEAPITPTNHSLKPISNQGSTAVQAVEIDQRALFVQKGGTRVFEVVPPSALRNEGSLEYNSGDRTILIPEMGEPGITRMAVQRQPDTRVHCVRSDGTVAVLVSDPAEDVIAWVDVTSTGANGAIEDVVVLPGTIEDDVYYVTRREINGSTYRFLEKWALEAEARGGSTTKIMDCWGSFSAAAGATSITSGATHLAGSTVVAWGSGTRKGSTETGVFLGSTFEVSTTGGGFDIPSTLASDSTTVYFGLAYPGWFKSAKLAYAAQAGTALTQRKKINELALVMADVHAKGLTFGQSTESTGVFDDLPKNVVGASVSTDAVRTGYDHPAVPFPGQWDTDSRLVLKAAAPYPVTALGAVITIETKEKI